MAGKGSRPRKVDKSKYDQNYDKIFGKKSIVAYGGKPINCHCCGELLLTDKELENGFCVNCYT